MPALVMPPVKVEIVRVAPAPEASPPTQMAFAAAEIVPALVMPPEKVEMDSVAVLLVPPATLALPPTKMPV